MTRRPRVHLAVASGAMGGGTRHIQHLIEALHPKVTFSLSADQDGGLLSWAKDQGIEVFAQPYMSKPTRALMSFPSPLLGADILHSHGSRAGFYALGWHQRGLVQHWCHTNHGHAHHKHWGAGATVDRLFNRPFRWVEEQVAARATHYLSVSQSQLTQIQPSFGSSTQGHYFPNQVDLERFRPQNQKKARNRFDLPADTKIVGSVARTVKGKGFSTLAEALRRAPEWTGVWVGDGPELETFKDLASDLEGRMIFLGQVEEVQDLLPAFDRFALVSDWEGEGIALLEAAACALPIIASATHGGCEVVSDLGGRLIPVSDPRALATALRAPPLKPDPQKLVARNQQGDFSRLLELYQQLLP